MLFHLVPIWTLLEYKRRARASSEAVGESMLPAQQTWCFLNSLPNAVTSHKGAQNNYEPIHNVNLPRHGAAWRGCSKVLPCRLVVWWLEGTETSFYLLMASCIYIKQDGN